MEFAIKVATEIVHQDKVLIIGSQSILGSFDEHDLPAVATLSDEVDIAPLVDDEQETIATLLDGQAGEWSSFHDVNGFYIQGVGQRTAVLPRGWKDRLVEVKPPGAPDSIGLCLDPLDLCVAKLVAGREKDWSFVDSLIGAGLIDPTSLRERVELLDAGQSQKDGPIINEFYRDRLQSWIQAAKVRHATVWP